MAAAGDVRAVLVGARGVKVSTASLARAVVGETGAVGSSAVLDATRALTTDLSGLGPLAALATDTAVTDICVHAPDQVWVDRGGGLVRADMVFSGEPAVRALAVRLASSAGRRLDAAQPWVDARLDGGVRLHAVLPPVAVGGTSLCLRLPRSAGASLAALGLPAEVVRLLARVVTARLAVVVTGGTGAGKTTLLAALLGACDPADRVVLVEDTGELDPPLPHVVRLQSRAANVEGAGAVTLRDLVRQALRMRPDRLVVGEVRGAEVADLLLALGTGHEGGAATVHANAASELPARLEALGALAGLDRAAVHAQLAGAVQVVVHVRRTHAGRSVSEVGVVRRGLDGWVVVEPAWRADGGPCPVAPVLAALLRAREPAPVLPAPAGPGPSPTDTSAGETSAVPAALSLNDSPAETSP